MKKVFLKFGIGFVMCFILAGCGKKNLVKYESDLIGFDFSKYVTSSEGTYKDDYANITFEIDSNKIEDFINEISKFMSVADDDYLDMIVGSNIYKEITGFCPNDDVIGVLYTMKSGKKAKTRSINLTICDKSEKYFVNIIG